MIDNKAKEFFDEFEGVNEGLYSPFKIDVRDKITGEVHQCLVYLLDNFKPEILDEQTVLFENYTSKNEYFPEYKKRSDVTADSNRKLIYSKIKDII